MYRYLVWGLVLLVPLSVARAEDEPKETAAAKEYKALVLEFNKGRQEILKEYAKASDEDKEKIVERYYQQPAEYAARFLKLSQDHPKDPAAIQAQKWITTNLGASKTAASAKQLRILMEQGLDKDIQGQAGLALAQILRNQYEVAYQKKEPNAASIFEGAEQTLNLIAEKYGDVKTQRGPLDKVAKDLLWELNNLSVGKIAMEIDSEDTDGKKIKLSDYRGKVVALTFWGSWCPPCMAMVPHERSLVKRLENKPFALIGVNSDRDKDKLKQVMEEKQITWRSFWNGGSTAGPISKAYKVTSWPTIYVLDTQGIIRYRNVRGTAMDKAVDELLQEMESKK